MVLVTGASGFLGQHLVRHLSRQGKPVRALYHKHMPSEELKALPGVEWQQCDLLDINDVERVIRGIEEIYHCAAIVTFNPSQRREMLHFNPESTANVVNIALEHNVRKMVYVSSVSAIGRTGDATKEITEETEWGESRYNSAYGISKYIAEMEVWRGIGEGLSAVIVNPGIILGEGEPHGLVARLLKLADKEFPFYTGGITSFVDVDDVVKLLEMLMKADINEERFIISGGNFSYREVLSYMAAALHKKPPRYKANRLVSGLAWRLSALSGHSIITKETAIAANTISLYNNSKLLKVFPQFNYKPIQEPITRMAQSFINSYKK